MALQQCLYAHLIITGYVSHFTQQVGKTKLVNFEDSIKMSGSIKK